MTKTKTMVVAAVSVVMAGAMAMSFAACGKNKSKTVTDKYVNMDYASGTEINAAIGYKGTETGMFYDSKVGSGATFAGNYNAVNGGAKPATQAIKDALDVEINDYYEGSATSANLTDLVNKSEWTASNSIVDMATSDLSVAVTEGQKGTVLNLADYLQYMPNFKRFLQENPVVYLSLLQSGMSTSTGEGQVLYVAPYFDGMDDIEKGCLMRQDWIEDVLDYDTWNSNDNNDTFKTACFAVTSSTSQETEASGVYAKSYMGQTGSWEIESTSEEDQTKTVMVKKDYDAALSALKDNNSALYAAYNAIDSTGYSGKSGNIVDITNAALEACQMQATGEQLSALYTAYIKEAYSVNGAQYYGAGSIKYSEVFTGYSACWDVDDLTTLLRIVKCSSGQVGLTDGLKTVGIYPRDYSNSRTPDIISLVGELYGVRGATSRYENTYIDANGDLQDARADEKFWDSLVAFGGLAKEGLLDSGYIIDGTGDHTLSSDNLKRMQGNSTNPGYGFMQWDYSQTQTVQQFDDTADNDYHYGWVNTPVSLWDDGTTDDSGYSYNGSEKYMRFTDSWRSTKTSGLVVNASVEEDPNKLAACLAFVDFLYSNDGQITTTYAIQDTTGNSTNPNGQWYGTKISASAVETGAGMDDICENVGQWVIKEEYKDKYVVCDGVICELGEEVKTTNLDLEKYATWEGSYVVKDEYKSECFAYGGELYTGTLYKGKMTPTITDELFERFTQSSSNYTEGTDDARTRTEFDIFSSDTRGSFTNYARYVLGSTLPICVKDQSFENQMTAKTAQEDATKVGVSIGNNTINHCNLDVTEDNYFYTCVPTGFPIASNYQSVLDSSDMNTLKYETGTAYSGNSFYSMYHHVIWYGFTGEYKQNQCNVNFNSLGITDAASMIAYLNSTSTHAGGTLEYRIECISTGWTRAKSYWGYLKTL